MAAGPWTVFNIAMEKIGDGTFDLDSNTFKMALTTDAQALLAAFAGGSGNCQYSDLTNEVPNGSGYTTGGNTIAQTWTRSGAVMTFDCDDQSWPASTITGAKYAVIFADNAGNDDLLCFCELDTIGTVSTINEPLDVAIDPSGAFTVTQV